MAEGTVTASRTSRAIKIAQGLAIILIVLFHSNILLYNEGLSFRGSHAAIAVLGPALLSLFFFAAGRSFGQRNKSSLRTYVINRTDGYLWILLIWNIIYIPAAKLYQYLHTSTAEASSSTYYSLFSGFSVKDIARFLILPSNVTWFIYCITLYMIVSYFARKRDRLIHLLGAIVCFDILTWIIGQFQIYVNLQYFEIFLLACIFGDDIVAWLERSRLALRLSLVGAYFVASYAAFVLLPRDFPVLSTGIRLAGLMSLICVGMILQGFFGSNILSTLSGFMLPIYLMHSLLLYVFVSVIHVLQLKTGSWAIMALSTPAVGFACIVVCLSIFKSTKLMSVLIFRPKGFRPAATLAGMASARS